MQTQEFEAHFALARALLETHGDRPRALAVARRARDGFRDGGAAKARRLADVERWLTLHEHARGPR